MLNTAICEECSGVVIWLLVGSYQQGQARLKLSNAGYSCRLELAPMPGSQSSPRLLNALRGSQRVQPLGVNRQAAL